MADSDSSRGALPHPTRRTWFDRLWEPFWALPAAAAVAAAVLGVTMPEMDRSLRDIVLWVFPGGPDAARDVLTTIASAMISTTGVVFSITMVVLQLASSQFTPRVLGGFLGSRVVQATFGLFIATFVFCLIVLRSVVDSTGAEPGFVPRVSVSFAFLLALACVGCLLAFIRHITEMIQVNRVIARIGDETMLLVDQVFTTEDAGATPAWSAPTGVPRHAVLLDRRHGHVDEVDLRALAGLAERAGGVLVLEAGLGRFVTHGQRLGTLWAPHLDEATERGINAALEVTNRRSTRQDVTFGFRQLVDIGERALSPGTNDPTTATQVVDELHRILREVVQRRPPSPHVSGDDGALRLVVPLVSVEQLARLAVEELAHYGADSIQVPPRLRAMLTDLESCALPEYRDALARLRG